MAEASDLQEELDRRDAEIVRLRNLLIAKDAEMAEVKGRLTELEYYGQRLLILRARIMQRAPVLMRLARAIYRRLPRSLRGA
ncbi:MAG: hypothetical protein ACTHNY_03995 [Solirubrobacterales bacterium]